MTKPCASHLGQWPFCLSKPRLPSPQSHSCKIPYHFIERLNLPQSLSATRKPIEHKVVSPNPKEQLLGQLLWSTCLDNWLGFEGLCHVGCTATSKLCSRNTLILLSSGVSCLETWNGNSKVYVLYVNAMLNLKCKEECKGQRKQIKQTHACAFCKHILRGLTLKVATP